MERIATFEKISFAQYVNDVSKELAASGIHVSDESPMMETIKEEYKSGVRTPVRSTGGSAGFDFIAPYGIDIVPGGSVKILTGVRVRIDEGWLLAAFPRSSLGFKYRLKLDNTVGIIDSDYYYADNEGHIMLKMTNESDKYIHINPGDKIAQGIFLPYGITTDDNATGKRTGGFGSTGR